MHTDEARSVSPCSATVAGSRRNGFILRLTLMSSVDLTPVETRILGCLLEKERTTPENYPLSLNSVVAACNQTTNRDPVVAWDEKTIETGLNSLREKKLATVVFGAGSRVQKYRHNLLDHFDLERHETALLCVLLLRGPQTPGELRARAERMVAFNSLQEVEACLEELGKGDAPLVRILPARPGQKERRYVQLISGEPPAEPEAGFAASPRELSPPPPSRIETIEKELASVKTELHQLREEFAAFRRQFEQ